MAYTIADKEKLSAAIRNFIEAWDGEVDAGMFFIVIPDGAVGNAFVELKKVLPPKSDDPLVAVAHELVEDWEWLMDEDDLDYSDLYGIKDAMKRATRIMAGFTK